MVLVHTIISIASTIFAMALMNGYAAKEWIKRTFAILGVHIFIELAFLSEGFGHSRRYRSSHIYIGDPFYSPPSYHVYNTTYQAPSSRSFGYSAPSSSFSSKPTWSSSSSHAVRSFACK